jgi:hypothetical protein
LTGLLPPAGRSDQPDFVTESADLPPPMVGACAGLHRYDAFGQVGEEQQYLRSRQLLPKNDRAILLCRMKLNDIFG